jgi:NAD(P)-dependent dehydrogenase (short-subunit alcohol dehydrogenase family)
MTPPASQQKKVAIITGASQGIGAGLVEAYRRAGYAAVGTSRSIGSSDDPGLLTVQAISPRSTPRSAWSTRRRGASAESTVS